MHRPGHSQRLQLANTLYVEEETMIPYRAPIVPAGKQTAASKNTAAMLVMQTASMQRSCCVQCNVHNVHSRQKATYLTPAANQADATLVTYV